MESFSLVAPYYETLMRSVPYGMWLEYLRLHWSLAGIEPKTVLEVCCGTGKLSRMLAQEGYGVQGVDKSEAMIREARDLAASEGLSIPFHCADAAQLEIDCTFDAGFSFFDSLNNIVEIGQFRAALANVRRHLNPGGHFLFDLNTAFAFEQGMFDQEESDPDEPIRYRWRSSWDSGTRICTIHMEFQTADSRFEETHVQRAYTEGEVVEAMLTAGFVEVGLYDSYTLNRPHSRSDRVHVSGKAPS
ncbi:class I SAM-dependent methyltransferase [Fimbriimonadia bacterium ATM]|nr:MAG: class I SAM-dependent methyltransferase [Armatimonadota bacterium]MBC6968569.1 class I SAM-dependent methyltransferase [Armatimonadota bacterium]MCE7898592.1 class I SAM-dependent methyltransferase [Armatimonadetes bacterium ATM1]MDL1928115.1 class I SAM-dependent methyltransferase [Fimbriimonadia bacterium ATM]RIJ98319.1 MAG: hypothetical protein DCC45_00700 [Armatimonadota bacterium]